jgi:hypothetical protein
MGATFWHHLPQFSVTGFRRYHISATLVSYKQTAAVRKVIRLYHTHSGFQRMDYKAKYSPHALKQQIGLHGPPALISVVLRKRRASHLTSVL